MHGVAEDLAVVGGAQRSGIGVGGRDIRQGLGPDPLGFMAVQADIRQAVGDAQLGAQGQDPVQEPLEIPPGQVQVTGQAPDLLGNHRLVGHQHIGQEDGIEQAMVTVIAGAQRVGQGVDAPQALLEGHRSHRRGHQHAFPGVQVLAVAHCPAQVLLHQAHAFHGNRAGHRVVQGRAERLDMVGQGIHAGGGGQRGRQAAGQQRVEDHAGGQQFGGG